MARRNRTMSRGESILVPMEFTTANCSHECGYNGGHRIERGTARLTIRDEHDEHHLCLQCARTFLVQGAEQLRLLLAGADRLSSI
jgi:hypothetical protein